MRIFIPSRGRAQTQITLGHIPEQWRPRTWLVVPSDEHAAYSARWAHQVQGVFACPVNNDIAATRQWILDAAAGDPKVFMLDDDLQFFHRPDPTVWKLKKSGVGEMEAMLRQVETDLDRHVHVGLSARQMNAFCGAPTTTCSRQFLNYAYRRDIMAEMGVRFTSGHVMEDFDVALQLIRRGRPNLVRYDHAVNQAESNKAGGCSAYRTQEKQRLSAERLAAVHAPHVTVVQRKTKGGWFGDDARTDVRIAWQRAAKEGAAARVADHEFVAAERVLNDAPGARPITEPMRPWGSSLEDVA